MNRVDHSGGVMQWRRVESSQVTEFFEALEKIETFAFSILCLSVSEKRKKGTKQQAGGIAFCWTRNLCWFLPLEPGNEDIIILLNDAFELRKTAIGFDLTPQLQNLKSSLVNSRIFFSY